MPCAKKAHVWHARLKSGWVSVASGHGIGRGCRHFFIPSSFLTVDRYPGPQLGRSISPAEWRGGDQGTQAPVRVAALAPETPVEKTPALSRRALVARRPRPKNLRGASSLRRPRDRDAERCGQSVLVSGLAPSNHFLASLGSVTNPLRLIR